ncbi:MAG: hypothetical protein ACYC1C_20635 [Chloroflexota bacterium]
MKSYKTPTPEQVDRTAAQLVRREQRHYFFSKLENPRWIKPLAEKGFFSAPPQPVRDVDKGTVSFPPWPEATYLARVASSAPEDVLEVILGTPETENERVHLDFVEAVVAMPPDLAATMVDRVARWVRASYGVLLPEKAGRLLSHLARGGEVKAALQLARSLLAVRPSPRRAALMADPDRNLRLPPEPEPYFDVWQYKQLVERHSPVLVDVAGEMAFDVLCDTLNAAVSISQ